MYVHRAEFLKERFFREEIFRRASGEREPGRESIPKRKDVLSNQQRCETSSVLFCFVLLVLFSCVFIRREGDQEGKATKGGSVDNKTHCKHSKPDLGAQPLSCRKWKKCGWASILEGLFKEDELGTFLRRQFRRPLQTKRCLRLYKGSGN